MYKTTKFVNNNKYLVIVFEDVSTTIYEVNNNLNKIKEIKNHKQFNLT